MALAVALGAWLGTVTPAVQAGNALQPPSAPVYYELSGNVGTWPSWIGWPAPDNPLYDVGSSILAVGSSASGSFAALAGAQFSAGGLNVGNGGPGLGVGIVRFDGAGTVARLSGSQSRFEIGAWGDGQVLISGGALVDATLDRDSCTLNGGHCYAFVGNAAGSTGLLTLTGAGSELRTMGDLHIGSAYVSLPLNGQPVFGTPGGSTQATVKVLDGATLRSERSWVGGVANDPGSTGAERVTAQVTVDGVGSRWLVSRAPENASALLFVGRGEQTGGSRVNGSLSITGGGLVQVDGTGGSADAMHDVVVGFRGANGSLLVSGAGSRLEFVGGPSHLVVGRENGGVGQADILNGASLSTVRLDVAEYNGSRGRLTLDGAGTVVTLSGQDAYGFAAAADIGKWGGQGRLVVSGGAWLSLQGDGRQGVTVGDFGGDGTLEVLSGGRIDTGRFNLGWGSDAQANAVVDAGSVYISGVNERFQVGNGGNATLTVRNGGVIDATAGVAGCQVAGVWCGNGLGHGAGTTASMTITGAGSRVNLAGKLDMARAFADTWAGVAGGEALARLSVLNGGELMTGGGWISAVTGGALANGLETATATISIDGAGSHWHVGADPINGRSAFLELANTTRSQASLRITNGGSLVVDGGGAGNDFDHIVLGTNGGSAVMEVAGAGSSAVVRGRNPEVLVGAWNGGQGELTVRDGGQMSSFSLNVAGRDSRGSVLLTGAGSVYTLGGQGVDGTWGAGLTGVASIGTATHAQGTVRVTDGAELRMQGMTSVLDVGNGSGTGELRVDNGGRVQTGQLDIGSGRGDGYLGGRGSVIVDGGRIDIVGDWLRLLIGDGANGSLTVRGGGVVDASGALASCNGCGSSIGYGAGVTGTLTISGAGSEVRHVGWLNLGTPWVSSWAGVTGGTAVAKVSVVDGGRWVTAGDVALGLSPGGSLSDGTERGVATVTIAGAGSQWLASSDPLRTGQLFIGVGAGSRSSGEVVVRDGGLWRVDATGSAPGFDTVNIGNDNSTGSVTVTGVGSRFEVVGAEPLLQVGRGAGANGSFALLAGATAQMFGLQVGRLGGTGTVTIDGIGTQWLQSGVGLPNQAGAAAAAIGRDGGTGSVTVSGGALWRLSDGGLDSRSVSGPSIVLGRGTAATGGGGNGSLLITGAGSRVELLSTSLGVAADTADNFNPSVIVGRDDGSYGELAITDGGRLLLQGNAVSTTTNGRSTALSIGGRDNSQTNNRGSMTITGAGSEAAVLGYDATVNVGRGKGSVGTLQVTDGGTLRSTSLVIGAYGNGNVTLDRGTVLLSGHRTDSSQTGAGLAVGRGVNADGSLGSGTLTLRNSSLLSVAPDVLRGGLSIGGDAFASGGRGVVSLTGASRIVASGSAPFSVLVGRSGSGVLTLAGGSSVDLGSSGSLLIASEATGQGQVIARSGSSIVTGYVGVASTAAGDTGGLAELALNSSSLTARTLEIGRSGWVHGSLGEIHGDVINRGLLSPGNSPGTLLIDGSYHNQGGQLVLEVESDGHGGFVTDHLVFTAGSTVDLSGLQVTFRFLGNTDPNAFVASGGLALDNFLQTRTADGDQGLSTTFGTGVGWAAQLPGVQFSATAEHYSITSFSIDANGLGQLNAVAAVPEPGTWALWAAGLMAVGQRLRRRRQG